MTEIDTDAGAFPTQGTARDWPYCGLTKLQWSSVQIAAAIAPGMLAEGKDEQAIAEKATLIACKTLEWSAP